MPIGAMAGATVISAGASIVSGNKAAKAAKQGADAAAAESGRQYDTTRADWAPWRETGKGALGRLASMYGIGAPDGTGGAPVASGGLPGEPGADAYGGFFTSPGYQFRRDQGVQAVGRSAASRGLLRSGAGVKAVARYADGLASSEYQAFGDRLAQIAGFGASATGSTAAAGDASSARIGQAQTAAANSRASSYLNTGSAISQGVGNLATAYMYQRGGGFRPTNWGAGW